MRKSGILLRHEHLLNLTRHVKVGLELGIFGAQFVGIMSELKGHMFALDGITHRANEQLAVYFTFNQVILRSLVHCFQGEIGIVQSTKDNDWNFGRLGVKPSKRIESLAVGKRKIGENDIDATWCQSLQAAAEAFDMLDFEQ